MKRKPAQRKLIFDEKGIIAFASQLKRVRALKNMTQEELSNISGLALSQVARIETARTNPTLSTIFSISRALGVSIRDLFDFDLE